MTNSLLKNHEYNNSVIRLAQKPDFLHTGFRIRELLEALTVCIRYRETSGLFVIPEKRGLSDNYVLPDSELIPEVAKALSGRARNLFLCT